MDENQKLDEICKRLFDTIMKKSPVFATYIGLHEFDKLMPDESRKACLEMIGIYKKFSEEFKQIKPEELDTDRKINLELAFYTINLSLFGLEEKRYWEQDPDIVSEIGDALFPLFSRDFAPFEERIDSIISRLEKASDVIEQTKTRISRPIKLWTEMAIESCERIQPFFEEILKATKEKGLPEDKIKRLENAITAALEAIKNYKDYMQKELIPKSEEKFYIGEEKFRKLIELRKLDKTPEQILEIGKGYLKETKEKTMEIANKIKPGATIEEVKKIVGEDRPKTFPEILEAYKESIKKSREFVIKNDLATVPENEELKVIETPPYLVHTHPFAAYFSPAKFDKKQLGIYIVTPTEQGNLGRYNYADIHNTSVHEGYPGHHLQLSCANTNPHLIRLFPHSTEFVEGWAHYCEEYMREKGYDTSQEGAFAQTKDMAWRAARIIIDVKLSTGKMSFDEAVKFLMEEAGLDKEGALAEIKRYTQSPGYQLSYLLGKHMIKELKNELKNKFKDKFSDKIFHDTMLYAGSLPIHFQKEILEEKFSSL